MISGGGSNMVSLLNSMGPSHPAQAVLVIANEPNAGGLAKAINLGVDTAVVDHRAFASRPEFEAALQARLDDANVDLLCLAGFMRILTAGFTKTWEGRCLNIHPSLLPKFKGLNTHQRAIQAGETRHGCTVHEVTADLDDGPILGQAEVPILPDDTPDVLANRVLKMEHKLYPRVLDRFAREDRTLIALNMD